MVGVDPGLTSAGRRCVALIYKFGLIADADLAGVVVSYKGKLLVREIKSN